MTTRTAVRNARFALLISALAWTGASAHAGERFVSVPLSSVRFEGTAPELPLPRDPVETRTAAKSAQPYVVLDGRGETYMHYVATEGHAQLESISIRADESDALKGRLFRTKPDGSITVHRFTIGEPSKDVDARRRFYEDMLDWYSGLARNAMPGAAWFRHRLNEARRALGTASGSTDAPTWNREPPDPLDLFTGARAIAENLDLERDLQVVRTEDATVDIATIQGVTTQSIDWKLAIKDKKPELDPLAKLVPSDQHAVFFPTFDAMTRVLDEVDAQGTPLMDFFDARVEDLKTKDRYQDQLLLPLSTVGRLLGPSVVSSVAMTGSDPFLPGGTDLVILFDCKQPALLEGMLATRRTDAEKQGATHVEGAAGGLHYAGCTTPDRRVSSYATRIDSTVVVTNSLVALVRIAKVASDSTLSLLAADEYVWFRDRYPRGDAKESALLVLSDATIRRWAGPRSRIGDARRIRAAAAMAEIQARHLDELAAGKIEAGAKAADPDFPISADFTWTKSGVYSPSWGSLAFLTPVSELPLDRVSPAEKQAYDNFRMSFQMSWHTFFDPIALRFEVGADRVRADVTVRPLTLDSDMKELERFAHDAALPPDAGDPHAGALFHVATGLAKSSELARIFDSEAGPIARQFGADPLGWLGSSIALYGERDPWWQQTRDAGGLINGEDTNWYAIPIVLQIAVKDPLKLAGFLTALRAFADQSAPNLTTWENRTWQETTYVRVGASETLGISEPGREAALYYVPLPEALVVTLREDLLKQVIERRKAKKSGETVAGADRKWLGTSVALHLEHDAIDVFADLDSAHPADRAADAAWSALPILNEWKRRFPAEDPLKLHERLWGVRLVSPGGGTFAWNDELQTMESVDYGRPGAPKPSTKPPLNNIASADMGLTFESGGVRAVVEIAKKR